MEIEQYFILHVPNFGDNNNNNYNIYMYTAKYMIRFTEQ